MDPRFELKKSTRFNEHQQWELIIKLIALFTVAGVAIFLLVMHFLGLD